MAIDNIADKIRAARELREHLLSDRYRPGYHFAIAEDIGRPGGHISSVDLVHWRHHPDALLPDDYDGGIAYLTYWRVNDAAKGQAITRRVYPEGDASTGVALFTRGGSAACSAVRAWEMAPSNTC